MAVDDLDLLREQLPDLFEDLDTPSGWEEDWIFVPVDSLETGVQDLEVGDEFFADEGIAPFADTLTGIPDLPVAPAWPGPGFPGVPLPWPRSRGEPPPPDALAFYLPFHHYHPVWWGVYLTWEGVAWLSEDLAERSGAPIEYCRKAARFFLYGHEAFHHQVECLATRLEVSHRRPVYRTAFNEAYLLYEETERWFEEILACAHGFRYAADKLKGLHKAAVLEGLLRYLRSLPPWYSRGAEFIKPTAFVARRNALAEEYHRVAFPVAPKLHPDAWSSFPHGFSGINRITSRVNYIVHRGSPLGARLGARFLRYRDVVERLQQLADCQHVRKGKGSHEIWQCREGKPFPVPRHPRELKRGTLQKIISQAGLTMSLSEFQRRAKS